MVAITRLGTLSLPTGSARKTAKAAEGLPPYGMRLGEFDTWRPGYGGASVLAVREGTTEHAALYADPALTVARPAAASTPTRPASPSRDTSVPSVAQRIFFIAFPSISSRVHHSRE